MPVANLSLKYILGINPDITSNIFYFDKHTLFYTCGYYCVFFNSELKSMKFYIPSGKGYELSAMTMSSNRKLGAVALASETPTIYIFNTQTLEDAHKLVCHNFNTYQIVSLNFSTNTKYIVAICNDPDGTLLYWLWSKSKLLYTVKTNQTNIPETLYFVSFNPQDDQIVYVFGNGVLKLYRFSGGKYQPYNFPKLEPQDNISYCWDTNDRLLVGTKSSRVLFIEDVDVRLDLNLSDMLKSSYDVNDSNGVTAIVNYAQGFITACGSKYVQIFEKTKEKFSVTLIKSICLPVDALADRYLRNQVITGMAINPTEEVLVISTDMKQIYSTQINPPKKHDTDSVHRFSNLIHATHYKSITGCSVCWWKPLVATSSLDGTIKLWNYELFTLELSKDFSEEIYSISIHPTGLFLLAGFSHKLRFMYILRDDFKTFKEFNIRSCVHCNFSQGGHMFAAADCNFIHVYSSITFKLEVKLKGHTDKVQKTSWHKNDTRLMSCGLDGVVYDWEIRTGKRLEQCIIKSSPCIAGVTNTDSIQFNVISSDSLKVISKSSISQTYLAGDLVLTSLALSWSNTILLVGTSRGHIRVLEYFPNMTGKSVNYPCHNLDIVHMVFSTDDRYLITTSNDASIAVWRVEDPNRMNKHNRHNLQAEEVLVLTDDLDQINSNIFKLKARVETLTLENQYQLHLKSISHEETMKELRKTFTEEIEKLDAENALLLEEQSELNVKFKNAKTDIIETHRKELEFVKSANDSKLAEEYERYEYLNETFVKQQQECDNEYMIYEEETKTKESNMIEKYEQEIEELGKQLERYQQKITEQQKKTDEVQKRIEEDVEGEFLATKLDYETKLFENKRFNIKIKEDNNILKKKLLAFPKEVNESKDECNKYMMEVKRLLIVRSNLENDIQLMREKVKIQQRGLTQQDKDFFDLKLENHAIETTKLKLEYDKIVELRQQIDQRETENNNMKTQIEAMESELENFNHQFFIMDRTTVETKEKLAAVSQELDQVHTKLKQKTELLEKFCADLINSTTTINDPHKLKKSIKLLYAKYNQKNTEKIVTAVPNLQLEWSRQRNHFEYSMHKEKYQHNRLSGSVIAQGRLLLAKSNKMREQLLEEREKAHNLSVIYQSCVFG